MSSAPIDLRNAGRTIHVGVLLMGGTTEVLDIAPIDLLGGMTNSTLNSMPDEVISPALKSQALDMQFHWVNETGKPAKLTVGMTIQPTDTFETCPTLDVVLIGAHQMDYHPNEAELTYIRSSYAKCHSFLCICGGFMAPFQAGILSGLNVTGPREIRGMFKDADINYTGRRWERDGKMWTSGALVNGVDMMRVWADETFGGEDTLMDRLLETGGWPVRDVEYKDDDERVKGKWLRNGRAVDVKG